MRKFEAGDILYSFLGENIVKFEVIAYLQDGIIVGKTDEGNLTLYEEYCYLQRHNAILGMKIYLKSLEVEVE